MISYYALWIPLLQKGNLNIIKEELDEVILKDLPEADELRIKGHINKKSHSINLYFRLSETENVSYELKCIKKNNTGFIVYCVEISDKATDFVSCGLRTGFHKAYYHYIKGFFHQHTHHDCAEDSLLVAYHSDTEISLNDKSQFRKVVDSYLDCYIQKLKGVTQQNEINMNEVIREMSQNKNISRNLKFIQELVKNGYSVKGELGYCRFLAGTHRNNSSRKKRKELEDAGKEFEDFFDNLIFWNNHYTSLISYFDGNKSLKWGMAGFAVGILSLLVTACLEYCHSRQLSNEKQLEHIENIIDTYQQNIEDKMEKLHEPAHSHAIDSVAKNKKQILQRTF